MQIVSRLHYRHTVPHEGAEPGVRELRYPDLSRNRPPLAVTYPVIECVPQRCSGVGHMIVNRSRGNMQIGWRQLIHHEDTAMPIIHLPFMRPCQPRIMQEKKIAAIMCDHDQTAIRSKK